MTHKGLVFTWVALIASSAVAAQNMPEGQEPHSAAAPQGTPDTRYCMRIEAITGSRIETVRCWTRAEWAEQDVDVDREWAKEGVRVIS